MTRREELIKNINDAEEELKKYDKFFDSLEVGMNLIEYGMYDDFDVEVISWNKEKGTIRGKFKEGGRTKTRNFEYWELHLETRTLFW